MDVEVVCGISGVLEGGARVGCGEERTAGRVFMLGFASLIPTYALFDASTKTDISIGTGVELTDGLQLLLSWEHGGRLAVVQVVAV